MKCYTIKKLIYNTGLNDNIIDTTYVIHLKKNRQYDTILILLNNIKVT